jgi:hypothetical protein
MNVDEKNVNKIVLKYNQYMKENINKEVDPYGEEDWDDNDPNLKIIEEIKNLVVTYGGHITMMDLEADSSPLYNEGESTIHLIERLMPDEVGIIVYGGYKYEEEVDEYDVPYEDLEINILIEIKELLDEAIESDLLEEDI